jgi:processive 1,2-diacylglycerol beta-glucosyltransferase
MLPAKKLLILSCSTGKGHWRAGEALRAHCAEQYPDIEVRHIDIAQFFNFFAHFYIIFGYTFFATHFPWLYKQIYYRTDTDFTKKFFRLFGPILAISSKKLFLYIDTFKPDHIISTHFLPDIIFPRSFTIPHSTVITDYHPHVIWFAGKTNLLFSPTKEAQTTLAAKGISSVTSGIPLMPEFFKQPEKKFAKISLGIANEQPTILIMPTYTTSHKLREAITKIRTAFPHINICAITNISMTEHNIYVFGSETPVDMLMSAADIIITKAGGLTVSEALCKQKPIIVARTIPGQEDYNAAYIEKNNYGVFTHSIPETIKQIERILKNPFCFNKKLYPDPSTIILKTILQSSILRNSDQADFQHNS